MLRERLIGALGTDGVKTEPEDLSVYAFDAYTEGGRPSAVVLPRSTNEVSAVVKIARECGEPIVPRGAGTGLCGGASPPRRPGHFDAAHEPHPRARRANRRARVQPGLINLDLSRAVAEGLFYAPDPSRQKISTIGGNVGTNAGGPHCLSYGTTTNHVLGLEFVDDAGEVLTSIDEPGYDLTGALVGTEGTLGHRHRVDVRLMHCPKQCASASRPSADVESASEAVSAIIGAGIVPTALEIMDALIMQAVEAHSTPAFPTRPARCCWSRSPARRRRRRRRGAARDDRAAARRALVARRTRRGGTRIALGRAQGCRRRDRPHRAELLHPGRLRAAHAAPGSDARDRGDRARHALTVGNVFHAGDGNLHPLLSSTAATAASAAVVEAGTDILATCIAMGGTISGEHGIGYEKRDTLSRSFDDGPRDDGPRARRLRSAPAVQPRQDLPERRALRRSDSPGAGGNRAGRARRRRRCAPSPPARTGAEVAFGGGTL